MEVFMKDVASSTTVSQIRLEISKIIHGSNYDSFNTPKPANFNVYLHRPKQIKLRKGSRTFKTGCVTFHLEVLGIRFLEDCERMPIKLGGRKISFRKSCNPPRLDVLERIKRTSFEERPQLAAKVAMERDLTESSEISSLQFGWECRDDAFSVEFEIQPSNRATSASHRAQFSLEERDLVITLATDSKSMALSDGDSLDEEPLAVHSSFFRESSTKTRMPASESSTQIGKLATVANLSALTSVPKVMEEEAPATRKETIKISLEYDPEIVRRIVDEMASEPYWGNYFGYDSFCDLERSESLRIPISQIDGAYWSERSNSPVVYLTLSIPPSFIRTTYNYMMSAWDDDGETKERMPSLSVEGHSSVSPFVSTSLRLTFASDTELHKFRRHWTYLKSKLDLTLYDFVVVRRNLFSPVLMSQLDRWLGQLEWPVAFHLHALIANRAMNPRELLDLRPSIEDVRTLEGEKMLSEILRCFKNELEKRWYSEVEESGESAELCFSGVLREHRTRSGTSSNVPYVPRATDAAEGLFNCFHVMVTPTRLHLDGPFPERSNRMTRRYAAHGDCFLRVNFTDEVNHRLSPDHESGGTHLIRERVGGILKKGIRVGGRQFEFLAYSQSALKEHAVWFVTPFWDEESRTLVNAASIRQSIGHFENCRHDPRLIYCPARYAARLSQAFTSTDNSITVQAGEVAEIPDIKRNGSCFTDGAGSVSKEMAHEITQGLRAKKRRGLVEDGTHPPVRAFQIRYQGCKGVVCVDHTLEGRKLVLRPSMTKFEAYNTNDIEIASYFAKPSKLFLNRPLIMLLEGLGVPTDAFLELQRTAVKNVQDAIHSLSASAKLLDTYGLGTAFRLPSILLNLEKLGCELGDHFDKELMKLAIFHALRELKYRARIPAPGYTLVGVADVHSYLREGQVFVCVQEPNEEPKYLKGPVLITRSPVIHPGDVQIVDAIGPPPANSPFAVEPLQNTVVFSTLGSRSLPSCLGGGDLDGDVYNITEYKALRPKYTYEAAGYEAAERKELETHSTIDDVADFVVEYIISDKLGVIATNWLIFADMRDEGILDEDCLSLAKLHSDAVDYPKTGTPVSDIIPKPKAPYPDWSQPEVIKKTDRVQAYYKSQKALGILYRDIQLFDPLSGKRTRKRGLRTTQDKNAGKEAKEEAKDNLRSAFNTLSVDEDNVYQGVILKARSYLPNHSFDDPDMGIYKTIAEDVFFAFSSRLEHICASHSLHSGDSRLSEAEAILGVISERTSQFRRRQELMSKLREVTGQLVIDIRYDLQMGDESDNRDRLLLAIAAWKLSYDKLAAKEFGARSFWWVCLGAALATMRAIDGEEDAA
ncbi:RdRP-domain-containing protein [Schizopora paradoxa]|uniref:RNA-dependent RNA polymerase n=1 Tax=Schizopora paradoxa TaxID=27342 RepID=A0A0H2RZ49_9AGAM|nr:RdRP-domain-containing protein [Schizopora paradoxa]